MNIQKNRDVVQSATQSALDLTKIEPVANTINELANILIKNIGEIVVQVMSARLGAQQFSTPDYIDLISFLNRLIKVLTPQNKVVTEAAKKTLAVLNSEQNRFIIANSTWGPDVQGASGLNLLFSSCTKKPSSRKHLLLPKKT